MAANSAGLVIAPRGGGTQLGLGNALLRLDAVVDMRAFNEVVQHNAADLTLVVQAGITLAELHKTLAKQRQFLPLDAPLPHRATIGGTLATGVSGPLRWHYGSARDLVIGMQVMQADGRLTRSGGQVVKNVSGYDMARLHVGGIGSLGIITEVAFKLTPMPRDETTFVVRYDSLAECLNCALVVFNSGVIPLAMTAYDSSVAARIHSDDFGGSTATLAIRLGGRPRTLERMEHETLLMFERSGGVADRLDGDDALTFWERLADFGWDDEGDASPVMSARISALPNKVADIMGSLSQSGASVVSQAGYGMLNAHWWDDGIGDDALAAILRDARETAHNIGGTLIVERAPLAVKANIDAWDDAGGLISIMRGLKQQYDPNGVINPNRFVGGI